MIERKANLEELSGNLTTNRTRFEEEMATYPGKKYLLIESANYQDIINSNYDTKFGNKAYLASIHSFDHKYDLKMMFMPDKSYSAFYTYGVFTYYLKNLIK